MDQVQYMVMDQVQDMVMDLAKYMDMALAKDMLMALEKDMPMFLDMDLNMVSKLVIRDILLAQVDTKVDMDLKGCMDINLKNFIYIL